MYNVYNEEFKKRYIEENEYRNMNLAEYLQGKFSLSGPLEEELRKDLYDFTVSEIMEFYKSLSSPSLETLMNINAQLILYTRYALANHLVKDSQNHYEEIDEVMLRECVNIGLLKAKVFTREQIMGLCDQLKNPCEQFVVLALFEGICGRNYADLANLKKENFVGNEVYLPSGKHLFVSDRLVHYMNHSVSEYKYVSYGDGREKNFQPNDDHVLKLFMNAKSDAAERYRGKILSKIHRISIYYDIPSLTPKTILESGRIDMIQEIMIADNSFDVEETIIRHKDEIEYRYGNFSYVKRYVRTYEQIILEGITKK